MTNPPTSSGQSEGGLASVAAAARQAPGRGLPPVHLWNPVHCGEIDITIRADGVWMHDPDGYHLVTPAEKLKIAVEDLPFRAVAVRATGDELVFTTDQGDETTAGPDHALMVETDPVTGEPAPRVHVRADLWARIARSVFYDLVERAEAVDGRLVVRSGGVAFPLGPEGAGL
jgi:hypothetical protein